MSNSPSMLMHFSALSDPRVDRTKRHNLLDIVIIAISAVISAAETWEDIAEYGRTKHAWFKSFLNLPNGIPSHDTFARVFAALNPEEFKSCFIAWIQSLAKVTDGDVIAIDGKTLRRSFDKASGKTALHMVSAWSKENNLVLAQTAVDEKSNEITAIPKLLDLINLTGATVTIDAMGCQKEIVEKIVAKDADYVIALKGNQGNLHEEVKLAFDHLGPEALSRQSHSFYETTDADHGRIENRKYWITSDLSLLENSALWAGLKSIGIVESTVETTNKITRERRYFITSIAPDATVFSHAVRSHWLIENRLHWVLDVTFGEDHSRIRSHHAAKNFAIIRHLALSLLQQNPVKRMSLKTRRLKAGWDNHYLMQVLLTGGHLL